MQERLAEAIRLREVGQLEGSRHMLLELLAGAPDDPQINYQCAWVHDAAGLERDAVRFYERAIEQGLSGTDLEGALLGLGSTYRCLGKYAEAVATFQRGIASFPENRALQVFLAMALYNIGRHADAMEILLRNLVETSSDHTIARYKRAILHYADKLDDTWE